MRVGIISGSGTYALPGFDGFEPEVVATPFGEAGITVGSIAGVEVLHLSRHGAGHVRLSNHVTHRANIWALKSVGVRTIIGVSAVGSLREEIHPGDLALPSQYLDFTKGLRAASFFGKGLVAHVSTAHPTCARTASPAWRSHRAGCAWSG